MESEKSDFSVGKRNLQAKRPGE